jgi:8-oxo-dGTP diphosphatase
MTVLVAAAVVRHEGRILLTRRMAGAHLAGLWELPGGKLDPGEAPEAAVVRECSEECAIDVVVDDIVDVTFHHYAASVDRPAKDVLLLFYECRLAEGGRRNVQHLGVADHAWVLPGELRNYPLPPPDEKLVRKLERLAGIENR